jgi:hypothetical protein
LLHCKENATATIAEEKKAGKRKASKASDKGTEEAKPKTKRIKKTAKEGVGVDNVGGVDVVASDGSSGNDGGGGIPLGDMVETVWGAASVVDIYPDGTTNDDCNALVIFTISDRTPYYPRGPSRPLLGGW